MITNRKKALTFFILAIILYLLSGIITFGGLDFGVLIATLAVVFLALGVYSTIKGKLIRRKK